MCGWDYVIDTHTTPHTPAMEKTHNSYDLNKHNSRSGIHVTIWTHIRPSHTRYMQAGDGIISFWTGVPKRQVQAGFCCQKAYGEGLGH